MIWNHRVHDIDVDVDDDDVHDDDDDVQQGGAWLE